MISGPILWSGLEFGRVRVQTLFAVLPRSEGTTYISRQISVGSHAGLNSELYLVLLRTQDQTDGRIVVVATLEVVEHAEVHIHLTVVMRSFA